MQLSVSCSLLVFPFALPFCCLFLPPALLAEVASGLLVTLVLRFSNLCPGLGVDFHPPLTFVFHLCLVVSLLVPLLILLASCGPGQRILVLIHLSCLPHSVIACLLLFAWLWVGDLGSYVFFALVTCLFTVTCLLTVACFWCLRHA